MRPACPLFEQCLGVAHEARDHQGLRYGLLGLGLVAVVQGDYGVIARPSSSSACTFDIDRSSPAPLSDPRESGLSCS